MKKFLIYALGCAALAFTGCSDDDDKNGGNGIGKDGQVEVKAAEITGLPASATISRVDLVVWDFDARTLKTVASSKWEDGFSLGLPEKLDIKSLAPVTDIFESDGTEAVVYSDKSVKISDTDTRLKAYDASGNELGIICIGKADYTVSSYYLYADGDCRVTGKYDWDGETSNYNLDLKTGWNLIYHSRSASANTYINDLTTSRPSGLGWIFGDEDDWDDEDGGDNGNGNIDQDGELVLKASEIYGIPSSVNIDNVRLLVWQWDDYKYDPVATAKWDNGFSLTFPSALASKYLAPVNEIFGDVNASNVTNQVTYSDENVKVTDIDTRLKAFDTAGEELGIICIGKSDYSSDSFYLYADGDCKVSGKFIWDYSDDKGEDVYDLDLKKGWNVIYSTHTHSGDYLIFNFTTSRPSGTRWVFGDEDAWEDDDYQISRR